MMRARAAVWQALAGEMLIGQLRIQAQRGHRGDQLESGSGRIERVAGTIEQLVSGGFRSLRGAGSLTSASTSPDLGSITTAAPFSL